MSEDPEAHIDSLAADLNDTLVNHFKARGDDAVSTRALGIACASLIGSYFSQIEPVLKCEQALGEFLLLCGDSIAQSRVRDNRSLGGSFAGPIKKDDQRD